LRRALDAPSPQLSARPRNITRIGDIKGARLIPGVQDLSKQSEFGQLGDRRPRRR
jgi:hypothetical protein